VANKTEQNKDLCDALLAGYERRLRQGGDLDANERRELDRLLGVR
jgi:hypothetical protein